MPLDRIHVLTVPPLPADPRELWDRFASVLGVDPGLATGVDVHVNRSLGCAETELLRRVNSRLPESFPRWNYLLLARRLLASDILSGPGASAPPTLPAHLEPILRERQERIIAGILASDCDLVGSPDDLRPGSARVGHRSPRTPSWSRPPSVAPPASWLRWVGGRTWPGPVPRPAWSSHSSARTT